jgi:catechol 2,3-dioxygenase-like lactoylglutathione lyase family enzyme/diadenosine tetraphosphate (Ap4A) HIT family hydrolase
MSTAIHRLVESCRAGNAPQLITRMASGWAVMGLQQVLRGYSLLLPDPVVPHLNAMSKAAREQFLADLGQLGDAVIGATQALRINYAIFGNLEPALHAHVHPRYVDEPQAQRTGNPWSYDWSLAPAFDVRIHGELRDAIQRRLIATGAALTGATAVAHLHHVDLTVSNFARSVCFYDQWLGRMGFVRADDALSHPRWRNNWFDLGLKAASSDVTGPAPGVRHVAFAAPSQAAVDELRTALCIAAVPLLDPPVGSQGYAPGRSAVFFADPDNVTLEFVCTPLV